MLFLIILRLIIVANRYRFLPIIFIYFSLTTVMALIRVVRSSSVTPLLMFLLLTRGIMVFILFCALLFNSKLQLYASDFTLFISIPLLITLRINPVNITNLSYRFVNNPLLILIVPSLILVVCSVRNLNVAQRT